jgi:hypothetical protein
MTTLQQLKAQYFKNKNVMEITDKEVANEYWNTKGSFGWGNCIVRDSGWAVIGQMSPGCRGDQSHVMVCKTELLKGD